MTIRDEGKTRFLDGMRVAQEHLDNLQDTLLAGLIQLRQSIGSGKVCLGFKVQSADGGKVRVSSGIAFDRQARPLILDRDFEGPVNFGGAQVLSLVVVYVLRSDLPVNGVPTVLRNDVRIEARPASPPYPDDAVLFAELHARPGGGFDIVQSGDWYLAPLDHRHSGQFIEDASRGFRFDGHPVGLGTPRFDSGFIALAPGQELRLVHGLNSTNLLVQVQSRLPDATVSCAGLGSDFWYELSGSQEVRLRRASSGSGNLDLRVTLWPFDTAGAAPVIPVANAGSEKIVEFGGSFTLDGSLSAAFAGHKLIRYIWTQFS
jgi:hypothetical protein